MRKSQGWERLCSISIASFLNFISRVMTVSQLNQQPILMDSFIWKKFLCWPSTSILHTHTHTPYINCTLLLIRLPENSPFGIFHDHIYLRAGSWTCATDSKGREAGGQGGTGRRKMGGEEFYMKLWRPLSWCSGEEPACQCRRHKRLGFHPWIGKIPWRRK